MSVCQNVPRFLPEHDRKLGIPNGIKRKETHAIDKKQKYFRSYPRKNHFLRHDIHARHSLLPPLVTGLGNALSHTTGPDAFLKTNPNNQDRSDQSRLVGTKRQPQSRTILILVLDLK